MQYETLPPNLPFFGSLICLLGILILAAIFAAIYYTKHKAKRELELTPLPLRQMHAPPIAPDPRTRPSLAHAYGVLVVFGIFAVVALITIAQENFLMLIIVLFAFLPVLFIYIIIGAHIKKTPQRILEDQKREKLAQERDLAARAREQAAQAPPGEETHGVLGAAIYGSLPWCVDDWFLLPERQLAQHGVIIGATGSGKTVTLLRIVYLAAKLYGYKVFFVDAKPSRKTAARFIALLGTIGIRAAMFPKMAYNGWNGDGNTILNRLMAIESFSEPYYKAACKRVLNAICKPTAPTSSKEFLHRLDTLNIAQVPGITAKDLAGVQNRYHAFFDTIEGQLDGQWSFDTVDAGYLLLDGTALKEEAASLGRYLVEDFAHYVTTRKPEHDKTLLIIDEYSALSQSGADTANLFERIRESGGAIIVAGQGYASMGEDIERMLDAANFYAVHNSTAPEKLTERAGTAERIIESYQFGGPAVDQFLDKGTTKIESQPEIHPDQIRRLSTGQCAVIAHGRYALVQVTPAPEPDQTLIEKARAWIDDQPQPISQEQYAPAQLALHTPQPQSWEVAQPPDAAQALAYNPPELL
jgi:hypothetical protein